MPVGGEDRRYNGWSFPPSKRQVTTVTVILLDIAVFFVVLSPGLPGTVRIVVTLFFILFATLAVLSGTWAMTIDPIDPIVAANEVGDDDMLDSDEEFLHCRYCDSHVQMDSKHCWDCNKCVDNFDHHCPWLNTCIGTRNYGQFYLAIWSVLLMLGMVIGVSLWLLVELFTYAPDISIPTMDKGRTHIIVLTFAVVIVNFVLWLLVLTLVAFHTYLCYEGITTYEYLTGKTSKRKEQMKLERQARELAQQTSEQEAARNRKFGSNPKGHESTPVGNIPSTTVSPSQAPPTNGTLMNAESDSDDDESSAVSVDGAEGGMDDVFRNIVAQDDDTELRKEVSSFVFGSSVSSVSRPRDL